jgi:hypothetical protein
MIGACLLVVADQFRRRAREEDADAIAERLAERLKALESRVTGRLPAQAAVNA